MCLRPGQIVRHTLPRIAVTFSGGWVTVCQSHSAHDRYRHHRRESRNQWRTQLHGLED
jgi:hypothetical protein